jgi:hypothetical protein
VVDEFGLRDFINRQNISGYENGEHSGSRQPVGQCARRVEGIVKPNRPDRERGNFINSEDFGA